MTKTFCSLLTCLLFSQTVATSTLHGQDHDPLTLIPANAGLIARLSAPSDALKDIEGFVNKVQPGFGFLAKTQISSGLGQAIYNPEFKGVDLSRDCYLGVIFESKESQLAFLLIPATDVPEMQAAIGDDIQSLEVDGWVVLSKKEAAIAAVKACIDGAVDSAAKLFDANSLARFHAAHLSIAVNATPLQTTFAEELASGEDMLDAALEQLGQQITRGNPSMNLEAVMSMYRDLGTTGLQMVRDADSLVVGLQFTETDFRIETTMQVGKDSNTDKWLQSQPVNDMATLKSVPQGLNAYYALSGDPSALIDWSKKMLGDMLDSEQYAATFERIFDLMADVKFGAITGGIDVVDATEEVMRLFAVSEVSPAEKIREGFALIGEGAEYNIAGIQQKQSVALNAEQLNGHPIDIMTIQQTVPPELDPTGLQTAMNEKFYGPDGMVQRLMVKDGTMFQTMGGGLDAMKQLIETESWTDETLLKTRGRVHEQANVIVMMDVPNMLHKMARLIIGTGQLPIPLQPEVLDGLHLSPSYAGLSIATAPQQLQTQVSVPVETFQGFAQIGMFVQGIMGGGR